MCSNIPASPAYGVYISQLIRYVRASSNYSDFLKRHNSANLELLIDKASSIYLYVKLNALASWIFLSFTSFWRNSDSYEYKNKSARRIYDKRDDFNFKIINFSNMHSNIPASPAYGVYISQLIRYARSSTDTFTSHIDKKIFLTFLLTPYLYTFPLYENPSFIIFSAETEYIRPQIQLRPHHF
jgi:hypothetical protein